MKQTDVTYGQLDRVLRSLGFSRCVLDGPPPARVYEHEETGTSITTPPYPLTDLVWDWHLVGTRTMLDLNGIMDADTFDARVRKRSRNGRRAAQDKPLKEAKADHSKQPRTS